MITNPALRDALCIAFCYLPVQDLLSVSQTCKALWRICMTKQIWVNVWRTDVLQKGLPQPDQLAPLDSLSDSQMKAIVMHALRLHYTRTCSPERRHIRKVPFYQAYPITWTRIVDSSWLLVAMSDSTASNLSLYSIDSLLGAQSQDLLARAFLEGPVVDGLVDISIEHGISIALELRTPLHTVEILSVQLHEGSLEFTRLARHHGISHIRALQGTYLGYAVHDDVSIPSILDWRTDTVTHLFTQPDVTGGVVAMALTDAQAALLTPKKLIVMRISPSKNGSVQHSVIAIYMLDQPVEYADMVYYKEGPQASLRICLTHISGVYAYSLVESVTSSRSRGTLSSALLWSRQGLIMRPMFDRTRTTVSWLEELFGLSARSPPVHLVTTAQGGAKVHMPPQDLSLFTLSDRDMPALYAWSTRDYDQGLGLLVVGNMIGELALFSFSQGTFCRLKDALHSVNVLPWDGAELLPQTITTPHPPRLFRWDCPSEADVQQLVQLWETHWPSTLNVPDGWSRCSQSRHKMYFAETFSDAIGSTAWILETQCHFLGRPIPLLYNTLDVTLLKAGGLILIYRTDQESDIPVYHVMDPALDLADIVALLPGYVDFLTGIEDGVVFTVAVDRSMDEEVACVTAYQTWELRHGIDRWQEFKNRGGQASRLRVHWPLGWEEFTCFEDCSVCHETEK